MCPPCHKKVVTDYIFYFLLSLRGTSQNPQTQPNPSAPFPPTHDAIHSFLPLFYFVFLTWRLSCHFESLGYQLHNCHQHGLSSWFLKILPVKRRLLLVSLVCFTLIFLTLSFQASGPEVLTIDNWNKMSTKRTLIQQYLPSMTHHIWKDFNPKRAKGKKKVRKTDCGAVASGFAHPCLHRNGGIIFLLYTMLSKRLTQAQHWHKVWKKRVRKQN